MRYNQLKRFNKIFSEKFYLLDINNNDNHYLINVSGSTYNVYNLKLYKTSKKIFCNCPDSKKWANIQTCVCKHVCFVLYKIFNLNEDEVEEYNFSDLNDEQYTRCIEKINSINFETNIENDIINDELIARFNELKSDDSKSSPKDIFKCENQKKEEDCPICYDKLESNILKCPSCKNSMHKNCMELWLNSGQDTCPYCRSKVWTNYLNKDNGKYYLNLM